MRQSVRKLVAPMRQQTQHLLFRLHLLLHTLRMRHSLRPGDESYEQYLRLQLMRTLSKQDTPLPDRAKDLINRVSEVASLANCAVLCVGCRNRSELDYFRRKGAKNVLGIDLYSNQSDILVMDMHAMTFPANSFEVVYSSHSLEHALHPDRATQEFLRVVKTGGIIAIEVPVNYETRGSDLVDFVSVDTLLALFEPHVEQILWSEHGHTAATEVGTEIVRVIFRVVKSEGK